MRHSVDIQFIMDGSHGQMENQHSKEDTKKKEQTQPSQSGGALPKFTKKNWDKIVKEVEEEEKKEGDVNTFFQSVYAGADDDAKRAMMKSFYESAGTVLSTNWDEVSKEKIQVKPPDGCEYKKWK